MRNVSKFPISPVTLKIQNSYKMGLINNVPHTALFMLSRNKSRNCRQGSLRVDNRINPEVNISASEGERGGK